MTTPVTVWVGSSLDMSDPDVIAFLKRQEELLASQPQLTRSDNDHNRSDLARFRRVSVTPRKES